MPTPTDIESRCPAGRGRDMDTEELLRKIASARGDLFHLFPFHNPHVYSAVNKLTEAMDEWNTRHEPDAEKDGRMRDRAWEKWLSLFYQGKVEL